MTKITAEEIAARMADTTKLVRVTTTAWSASARDDQGAATVAKSNNADDIAWTVRKNLLAGCDAELKEVRKAQAAASGVLKEVGTPFRAAGGGYIVANRNIQKLLQRFGEEEGKFKSAKAAFVTHYPARVAQAASHLGSAYDPSAYPDPQIIADEFTLDLDISALPVSGSFKSMDAINEGLAARLSSDQEEKQAEALRSSQLHVFNQLIDQLQNLHDRAASTEAKSKFYESALLNPVHTAEILDSLNLSGSESVTKLCDTVRNACSSVDVDTVRKKPEVKARVAAIAARLVKAATVVRDEGDE